MTEHHGSGDDPQLEKKVYQPLYQQIALWGFALGRPFTAQEVADFFGLTLIKANGMLHYICAQGEGRVSVRKKYRKGSTPMKKQVLDTLEILAIADRAPAVRWRARRRSLVVLPVSLNDLWRPQPRPTEPGEQNED